MEAAENSLLNPQMTPVKCSPKHIYSPEPLRKKAPGIYINYTLSDLRPGKGVQPRAARYSRRRAINGHG
ncbi:hypothetical protein CEXT_535931 [Caerostris extrusa]|uniref:Uncharacterized protein n=1 Tax=Caerostris extrusa TaxID=172846 RepID=A0AAV4QK52_CAEEX|nr:hypothetical protein CEXT_535931 [Caerostris extrusa]